MVLQTIVVDDEQLARDELCFQLQRIEGIEVVGQASNGFEVARQILERGIDTHLVFVTAYDQYALEAFNVSAVDYLLKPVEPLRLEQAVERVRRRLPPERDTRDNAPAGGEL